MTYEEESKQISENKKSGKASIRHEFKAAKWTFPNGHPRCLDCGQEESVSGFCEPTKGDELVKGSLQRKHPFNPKQVEYVKRKVTENWTMGHGDVSREEVPRMEGNDRTRAIHRLHSLTPSRRNPDTGEREFLLHRGQTAADAANQDIGHQGKASFTPIPKKAADFAKQGVIDLDNNNFEHLDEDHPFLSKFGNVYSAWVPESKIHSIPNQWGSDVYENPNEAKGLPGRQFRYDEHEVIIDTHGLNLHQVNKYDQIEHLKQLHQKHIDAVQNVPPAPIKYRVVKSEIDSWFENRVKNQPNVKDLIKGQQGDWKKEGYKVSIDHDSTWSPKKGITEFHVVAHSPAGKPVGRYTFHHNGNSLKVSTADTDNLHQRKGLASEAYRLIEHHTGLKVQPDKIQSPEAEALWNQPNRPFGKSESNLLHLEHYSHQPSLDVIDPKFHGTGVKGEESRRKKNPDWVDRSYHYLAGTTPEATVGSLPYKYISQVPASKVYDYQKDPQNLKQKSMWGSSLDRNLYEKNIKDAGYHGYINHGAPGMGSVVALFHPVNVNKINKSEILVKKVDEKEFHSTIASGASNVGNYSVDHLPHMNLADHHAQYIKDLHDPNTKLPSGLFDEGISPKLVHKMPYGTFMIKPFKEDGADTAGLATMTAKNAYDAGGIGHLNEDVSATMIHHPENPNFKIPVVVSKFQDHVTKTDQVPSTVVNPKECGQVMVMDYLLGNHDRHSANSLVNLSRKNEEGHYSPLAIDHAYSFNYGDEGLDYFIKNSASSGGFGKSAKMMNEKHRAELAGWYKNHGEKIHNAMQKSVDSVKDPNTKEYLRQNIKNRHDSLMEWANATGESYVSDIEPEHYSHPNEKGEGIMDDLSITPIESKNDLDKLHEMYQKHLPSGYNRSMYMQMAAKKLHGISSEDLSDYFSEPVDHRSDFKNDLLFTMIAGYHSHPNTKNVLIETLRKNKDHPDHAKPIYPFLQRTIEKEIEDRDVQDRKKAALDKLETIKRK